MTNRQLWAHRDVFNVTPEAQINSIQSLCLGRGRGFMRFLYQAMFRVGGFVTLGCAGALVGCGGGASSIAPSTNPGVTAVGAPISASQSQTSLNTAPAEAGRRSIVATSNLGAAAAIPATSSIFSASDTPINVTANDPHAVELGVKFTSSQAGTITAIRFYKGPKNTGTHVAHLWDSTGNLLADATFTAESTSGWQQVSFSSPVAIAANSTYTASYHTSAGFYSYDKGYFSSSVTNRPLTVPASGGVYVYGNSSAFPNSFWQGSNYWVDVVFKPVLVASPSPTPPSPSPTTVPGGGDLASTLCVGGSTYGLDDHDWFDKDSTLSVSDNWPAPAGVEWSNSFSYGRANNVGTDLSWYPSQAELVADGNLPPVATIIPGVGVALKSYEQPPAIRNQAGNQDQYFSGLLSSAKAYTTGYWVYSAQLPGGTGWWPAIWLFNENGGTYNEIDLEEQWGPSILGANVVDQNEHGSPTLQQWTTVPTGDSAQHTYGALVASNYVGFYVDAVPTTKQFARYATSALNPIMNLSVCSNSSWCAPAPAPGATAQMVVRYYAHYSPPATPAPCSPNDIATPAP